MSSNLSVLESTLKQHGRSVTSARKAIFEALDSPQPQSISQLIERLNDTVDRASIYRTILLFEQLNIVHRLPIGWKYKLELSDEFQDHHHHITCIKCSQILSLAANEQLESIIAEAAKDVDFKLVSHQIELRGTCSNCTKK